MGIGKKIFKGMLDVLKEEGHKECALDSGYTHAQSVWKHLIGEPAYIIKDQWGRGLDHLIWCIVL